MAVPDQEGQTGCGADVDDAVIGFYRDLTNPIGVVIKGRPCQSVAVVHVEDLDLVDIVLSRIFVDRIGSGRHGRDGGLVLLGIDRDGHCCSSQHGVGVIHGGIEIVAVAETVCVGIIVDLDDQHIRSNIGNRRTGIAGIVVLVGPVFQTPQRVQRVRRQAGKRDGFESHPVHIRTVYNAVAAVVIRAVTVHIQREGKPSHTRQGQFAMID